MSNRRAGLGRGLEALISTGDRIGFALVPLGDIDPNPHQPRVRFDEEGLDGLADSIREVGVLQPIVLAAGEAGRYVLVAGERRLRGARRAGLVEIPAVIRTVDDRGWLTEALVENIQREDLSPLEEAGAYQSLLEDFGMKHEDIGRRVGKSRATITNSLRLLALPAFIQGMLERGELTAGHARALIGVEDRGFAEHVATRAAADGWSVRQVEEAVRARRGSEPATPSPASVREVRPVEIIELEHRLTDQLGTKVRINYHGNKGRLQIDFGSLEDLERLYRRFFREV